MENTLRVLVIVVWTFTSIIFGRYAFSAEKEATPEIDRLSPEHVEHATFAMG